MEQEKTKVIIKSFKDEAEYNFFDLYRKVKKLSTAVFLVSNTIIGDDILKSKIKDLCLQVVPLSLTLNEEKFESFDKKKWEIEKIILELISLLDMASLCELISPMNGSVIKSEFEIFLKELSKFSLYGKTKSNTSVKNILMETIENKPERRDDINQNEEAGSPIDAKGQNRKNARKDLILQFIIRHNNVNIKDIVPNIRGCSEKTIQREIMELIADGKINKTGERRWSRYSAIR